MYSDRVYLDHELIGISEKIYVEPLKGQLYRRSGNFCVKIIGVKSFQGVLFSLVDPYMKIFNTKNFGCFRNLNTWLLTLHDNEQLFNGSCL